MSKSNDQQNPANEPGFKYRRAYATFKNGKPVRIPYVIDGLLTEGGFSILGGKPKHGKSSLTRYEAVCVSKGQPFLGRDVVQGEVILVNLEDPDNHVDNCLKALGYDLEKDAAIHIVDKVEVTADENLLALEQGLLAFPNTRLVIIDTLAKFIRVQDLNDYMEVLKVVERLHQLAKRFPHVHIQATAHSKKLKTEDPFEGLLGSTALRGEPATTIALYGEGEQHVFETETRVGRKIPATLLRAEVREFEGTDVVCNFALDTPLAEWRKDIADKTEQKRKVHIEERIIVYLQGRDNQSASQVMLLEEVTGKDTAKLQALEGLKNAGVVKVTGKKHSRTDPLLIHLNKDSLRMHDFINHFGGR